MTAPIPPSGRRRIAGAAVALVLVAVVLAVAGPRAVWGLLRRSDLAWVLAGAAAAGGALVMRGLRLTLLLPEGRLRPLPATLVAATAQAAALFVPARAGELALPWLLRRVAGWEVTSGVGTLLAARTLDLAALGLWAGVAVVAILGPFHPLAAVAAVCLVVPPLLLPVTLGVVDRLALVCLARRGQRGRRWARRVRRVRLSVDALRRRPGRLAAATAASVAMWAALWALAWFLLAGMGYRWPVAHVVGGSAVASLANLLPVNLIGNLGTLETGWTAAFIALGVPPDVAAATGLASHLWALLFAAVYGAAAWAILAARPAGR
ncbi:MAG TPA: flippase-like domain-containing protein [Thermoanaerobaculales bacterium]|nr:flippase-like domain-containing protein [Thermoanaerobaculales bacterium]HQP42291.1 flippase-like domain-containing protein [Thermoanaerobaculales bacterium]